MKKTTAIVLSTLVILAAGVFGYRFSDAAKNKGKEKKK